MSDDGRIILGSGDVHIKLFEGAVPTVDEVCIAATLAGRISGGATLEYKPDFYEAKDDGGHISKVIITDEEVTLKSGLLTFCGNSIKYLCDTARVSYTEKTEAKTERRIVKVGGVGNRQGLKYVICFHHVDPEDGDIWVMIVGNNQSGFSLSFAKDKETVVDAEFKALPMDNGGTLIHYEEEVPDGTVAAAAVV